ncbi:hypothetical protein [Poseidonibacter ostreae]|uniref:Plasmid replication protein RepL domain-containing protein n=1 Tax=Poseidonibacter ostreae TaxID=2654171 RepID=A0A6L4WTF7_9BACT|nr:hypothetical protein [Poseidonibacter ostreae]KAB7889559.1 hypothetical protein GBG19_05750 [Poseidonibacter ostreae]
MSKNKNEQIQYVTTFLGENSEIHRLGLLSKDQSQFLYYSLEYAKVTNILDMTRHTKEEIAKKIYYMNSTEILKGIDLTKRVKIIDKHITNLIKLEIFFKLRAGEIDLTKKRGSGTYVVNPFVFGRGTWNNLQKLREELKAKRKEFFLDNESNENEELEELLGFDKE